MPKVVITMPAYRAERTLAQTVADIPPGVADLLILVDDASPDNTAQLARDLGIDVYVHAENLGYGGNQKTCYSESLRRGADIVVLLHPDYQYEPKAVPLLIAPILAGDADMTFGSRFAGLGDPMGGGMPAYRYVGNRLTTILENLMLGSRFSELHSGLRAYTRRCLLSLPFLRYSDDFVFDSQLLVDAVTFGQRVVEVPIPTRYTKESSSIAVGRSLAYIVGSLGYCARRAAERGRRGRRSPVARLEGLHMDRSAREPQEGAGLASGREAVRTAADALLEAAGGYVVPADRLLALGPHAQLLAELGQERGWNADVSGGPAQEAETPEHSQKAGTRRRVSVSSERQGWCDAVLLLDSVGASPDTLGDLRRARAALDPEGLLVVGMSTPGVVHARLRETGFRMVEWAAPPPWAGGIFRSRFRAGHLGLAVARTAQAGAPGSS